MSDLTHKPHSASDPRGRRTVAADGSGDYEQTSNGVYGMSEVRTKKEIHRFFVPLIEKRDSIIRQKDREIEQLKVKLDSQSPLSTARSGDHSRWEAPPATRTPRSRRPVSRSVMVHSARTGSPSPRRRATASSSYEMVSGEERNYDGGASTVNTADTSCASGSSSEGSSGYWIDGQTEYGESEGTRMSTLRGEDALELVQRKPAKSLPCNKYRSSRSEAVRRASDMFDSAYNAHMRPLKQKLGGVHDDVKGLKKQCETLQNRLDSVEMTQRRVLWSTEIQFTTTGAEEVVEVEEEATLEIADSNEAFPESEEFLMQPTASYLESVSEGEEGEAEEGPAEQVAVNPLEECEESFLSEESGPLRPATSLGEITDLDEEDEVIDEHEISDAQAEVQAVLEHGLRGMGSLPVDITPGKEECQPPTYVDESFFDEEEGDMPTLLSHVSESGYSMEDEEMPKGPAPMFEAQSGPMCRDATTQSVAEGEEELISLRQVMKRLVADNEELKNRLAESELNSRLSENDRQSVRPAEEQPVKSSEGCADELAGLCTVNVSVSKVNFHKLMAALAIIDEPQ